MILFTERSTKTLIPESSYSTSRLLIGNFQAAETCLKNGLKDIGAMSFLKVSKPAIKLHPMELSDG